MCQLDEVRVSKGQIAPLSSVQLRGCRVKNEVGRGQGAGYGGHILEAMEPQDDLKWERFSRMINVVVGRP